MAAQRRKEALFAGQIAGDVVARAVLEHRGLVGHRLQTQRALELRVRLGREREDLVLLGLGGDLGGLRRDGRAVAGAQPLAWAA